MINVARGKQLLASAVASCVLAATVIAPASAMYYVAAESNSAMPSTGAIEVVCIVDATAIGQGIRSDVIILPQGCTAGAALDEMLWSSECQDGLEAIHNYDAASIADAFAANTLTVTTHKAGTQNPGTHVTFDTDGTEGCDTQLERWDSVVITVA